MISVQPSGKFTVFCNLAIHKNEKLSEAISFKPSLIFFFSFLWPL